MRIESTPARTVRMSKPKIEHLKSKDHPWTSIRPTWEGNEKGLEVQFESAEMRDVRIVFSKEDTARLIMFVVEKIIPQLVKDGQPT